MLVCMYVMCLAGIFDFLLLTFCLTVCGTVRTLMRYILLRDFYFFFTNDVPAAAWTIFLFFSLLSVQFGDELASPGKVLWIHITGFASWRHPSAQLRDVNSGGTARL